MRWLVGGGFVLLVGGLGVVPVVALGADGTLGVTLATEGDAVVVCRVLDGGPGDRAEFGGRDDIVFIHIQTVFEGFMVNTAAHGVDVE